MHGSSIVLAMEVMESSLFDIIRCSAESFGEAKAKGCLKDLLCALAHVHGMGLIHRDVKPGNVLVSRQGVCKLGDFGLARTQATKERPYSYQAATRWYRCPEMLWASRDYGPAVDVWACGCVLAELLAWQPLFPGSEPEQCVP